MTCDTCGNNVELTDTTYSNYNSNRAKCGQHTGDIYTCHDCERHIIDDFLSGTVHEFNY